jgi:hypothetical protein
MGDHRVRIVALDPGITTGWATWNDGLPRLVDTLQYRDSLQFIWHKLQLDSPNVIVCENFTYQQRTKVELYPVEVIGVVKLFAQINDIPVYFQTPAQAKKFWTDDKLRVLGFYSPAQPHGMDAVRHLLYHLTFSMNNLYFVERLKSELDESSTTQ